MPTQLYHISASFIGGGLGESGYFIYQDECETGDLVTQVTMQELIDGFSIELETDVQKIYLVPILTDPNAQDCILGCDHEWSELILSGFIPSQTPTLTPTVTPTLTPTLTPTPSSASPFLDFGPHIIRRVSSTVIEMEASGDQQTRYAIAGGIANAFGDGNVLRSSDVNGNNKESILNGHSIYREDETTQITSINTAGQVWWYDDFPAGKAYCRITNSNIPSFSAPTTATNLKYLPT